MKRLLSFLSIIAAALLISGCSDKTDDSIFVYKDSYVGDASAVGNSASRLQGAEHYKGFELQTTEEPYGIILNYDDSNSELDEKETAVYNATYLFALIRNADWITFRFNEREYTVTRSAMQEWYGKDLRELENEEETEQLLQDYWQDAKKANLFVQ